jgi:hypothetical protein
MSEEVPAPDRVAPRYAASGRVTLSRAVPGRVTLGRTVPGRAVPGRVTPGRNTPGPVTPGRAVAARLRGRPRGLGATMSRGVLRLRETYVLVARGLSEAAAFAYRVASRCARWPAGPFSPLTASAIPAAGRQRPSSRSASAPAWSFSLP